MDKLAILGDENTREVYKKAIVLGYERIAELLPRVQPIALQGRGLMDPKMDGPSVVWFVEKLSHILQRLCIQVKNVPDLQRVLVHVLDAEDLAAVVNNPLYRFLFEHPAFRVALVNLDSSPDLDQYRELFAVTSWDDENETEFHYAFGADFDRKTEWLNQVTGMYFVIRAQHREKMDRGGTTADSFAGFKNTLLNLPKIFSEPDIRNLRGALRGHPVFLIGAGPSVRSQMDFLRENQNRALLIAADTMLKPLANEGICPHIICSIERDREVLQLLDDDRAHAETILLALSVLDPECLEKYRGPQSVGLFGIPQTEFFPFDRVRITAGHSCMGLAMAAATHLGCNAIYLMGIDLCFDDEGKSHIPDVPYSNEESFRAQSESLLRDSILMKNVAGKNVRTHKFWLMFHHEFQSWCMQSRAKIYNLSPIGLPIRGSELRTLGEVNLPDRHLPYTEEILKARKYDATEQTKNEIAQFIVKAKEVERAMKDRTPDWQAMTGRALIEDLKAQPYYFPLLHSVLRTDMKYLSDEDREDEEFPRLNILEHLDKIRDALRDSAEALTQFLMRQEREKFSIF